MTARIVFIMTLLLLTGACAHLQTAPKPICSGLDWWEAGRTDGLTGLPLEKLSTYECRPSESESELYVNGREAGLVDYCSPAQGLAMGRSGSQYENVCPENLESAFLTNYKTGLRIRQLEMENSELQGRIENLVNLMKATSDARNIKNQVESLSTRRSQNSSEIVNLEASSLSF